MGKRLIGSVGLKPGTDTGFDLDEKGQIHGFTDTQFALPVGDDNQILSSLASEASGLKWVTASGVALSDNNTWTGTNIFNGFLASTPTELTISSARVTATRLCHKIDTEGDASTDNLDWIDGYGYGRLLTLQSETSDRDPTLRDEQGGNGTLNMAGDFTLTSYTDSISFVGRFADGTTWVEISRSNNG